MTLDIITIVGLVVTVTLSAFNIYLYLRAHRQQSFFGEIEQTFQIYKQLVTLRLDNPKFSYLFVIDHGNDNESSVQSEKYKDQVGTVREILSYEAQDNPNCYKEFRLKEKTVAYFIFSEFSHAVKRQQHSEKISKQQKKFTAEVVEYFCDYVLRNPRLLYYWNHQEQNMVEEYYGDAKDAYDTTIGDSFGEIKINEMMDTVGPFESEEQMTTLDKLKA